MAEIAGVRPTDNRRKDDGVPLRRLLRLAPWSVRRRILDAVRDRVLPHLPAGQRLRVACRVVPIAPPPRLRSAAETDRPRVRSPHGRFRARRDDTASPASVRRDNVDRVVTALDAAGVDWFRIPARSFTHTAVAVPERDRDLVVGLLEDLTAADAGRIEVVQGPGRGAGRRRRRGAQVLRVCWPVTDSRGSLVLGPDLGCEVEFWRERDGNLHGPRPNPVADLVPADEPVVTAPETAFSEFCPPDETAGYRTRAVFTSGSPDRVDFPIDVVYTWVDGADPAWLDRKARAVRENPWVAEVNDQAANDCRYISRDELRYSIRSLHCFAPWVRRIFLVTDDQVPAWLDTDQPRITMVNHREIFGDTGRLPTFNSQAIESRLHRIPGLSEHFLYLNDDVVLGRPVAPTTFFTPGGLTRFFPSSALVDSAPRRPTDPPPNWAGKNNRRLIQQAFGRILTRKMMHTPHPSRRSVIAEIEDRFAEHVDATAAHQFRHPDDVALLSSLQQYYAYLTGRAVPGEIRYMYTDLADSATPFKLARLLRNRHLDAFCLNDTDSADAIARLQAELLAAFLPAYLPFVSPYERAGGRPAAAPPTVLRTPVVARQASRAADPHPTPDPLAAFDLSLPYQGERPPVSPT